MTAFFRPAIALWLVMGFLCAPLAASAGSQESAPGEASLIFRYDGPYQISRSQRLYLPKDERCSGQWWRMPAATRSWAYRNDSKPIRIKASQTVLLAAVTTEQAGSDLTFCSNLVRFVPVQGGRYTLTQRGGYQNCRLELIDDATGLPPPSFSPMETPESCA